MSHKTPFAPKNKKTPLEMQRLLRSRRGFNKTLFNFHKKQATFFDWHFCCFSRENLITHTVLILAGNLGIIKRILCVLNDNAFGCSGYVQKWKVSIRIINISGLIWDYLHFWVIINDSAFLTKWIKVKEDRHITKCVVKPCTDNAKQKEIIKNTIKLSSIKQLCIYS